jgi:protein involved in polysaccharide export with SLBB domain
MRKIHLLSIVLIALMASACARQQQSYVIDPATGQPVPVMTQRSYAAPQYAQASANGGDRGLFGSRGFAQSQYPQASAQPPAAPAAGERGLFNSRGSAAPVYAQQPQYGQQTYQQPAAGERGLFNSRGSAAPVYAQQPQYGQQTYQQPASDERGLFNTRRSAQPVYAQQPLQQPYVLQYGAPQRATPQYAAPRYAPRYAAAPYAAAPYAYASASPYAPPYTLDAGDKLRIVVFGQDGISNTYVVDAGGNVNLPLVGAVPARGFTTQQLSQMIGERLKQGYVREPHVSVEVETYRPFFILGEVTNPGQYPYVADMTVEKAIAIAGGFSPRASKSKVELTRNVPGQQMKGEVPLNYALRPGDTVVVKERWF